MESDGLEGIEQERLDHLMRYNTRTSGKRMTDNSIQIFSQPCQRPPIHYPADDPYYEKDTASYRIDPRYIGFCGQGPLDGFKRQNSARGFPNPG